MVIVAVDQDYLEPGVMQLIGKLQTTEAATYNDHTFAVGSFNV